MIGLDRIGENKSSDKNAQTKPSPPLSAMPPFSIFCFLSCFEIILNLPTEFMLNKSKTFYWSEQAPSSFTNLILSVWSNDTSATDLPSLIVPMHEQDPIPQWLMSLERLLCLCKTSKTALNQSYLSCAKRHNLPKYAKVPSGRNTHFTVILKSCLRYRKYHKQKENKNFWVV